MSDTLTPVMWLALFEVYNGRHSTVTTKNTLDALVRRGLIEPGPTGRRQPTVRAKNLINRSLMLKVNL